MTVLLGCLSIESSTKCCLRVALRRRGLLYRPQSTSATKSKDLRLSNDIGRTIKDDYAHIRDDYQTPRNPIVLAHGLLGFDELHLAGHLLPGIHYWRGITEALAIKDIEVITASVPASASIEQRAAKLAADIEKKAGGKQVNIIA
ncbi:MAG: hypothetical protein M1835_002118 [Candelina submexicana]|nr:MAG: hypothetical protein M1835_002118 [Candelina submexicana]